MLQDEARKAFFGRKYMIMLGVSNGSIYPFANEPSLTLARPLVAMLLARFIIALATRLPESGQSPLAAWGRAVTIVQLLPIAKQRLAADGRLPARSCRSAYASIYPAIEVTLRSKLAQNPPGQGYKLPAPSFSECSPKLKLECVDLAANMSALAT